jgi:hypothetical protein
VTYCREVELILSLSTKLYFEESLPYSKTLKSLLNGSIITLYSVNTYELHHYLTGLELFISQQILFGTNPKEKEYVRTVSSLRKVLDRCRDRHYDYSYIMDYLNNFVRERDTV